MKITAPIIVFGRKKKRAIRRACGLIAVSCLTNQNGKTVYNHKAGNLYDLSLKEIELLRSILPKPKGKKVEPLQAMDMSKKHAPNIPETQANIKKSLRKV